MRRILLLAGTLWLSACGSSPPVDLMGAYRLDDGQLVSIRRSSDETLRYRVYSSGASGRLHLADSGEWIAGDGFSNRDPISLRVRFSADSLSWAPVEGSEISGHRCVDVQDAEFASGDITLRGQMHMPPGPGPFPAVVLVHGSGKDSAVEYMYTADFLAANGVAALVYDKRGTGDSDGDFTFDYDTLAADVSAGVDFLAEQSDIDPERIGLCGYSQGGWVAPLAALQNDRVRFVAVSYGMIESPTDEAVWETQDLLRSRGIDDAGVREATPLIEAAVNIVASGFNEGWDEFYEQKRATEGATWRDSFGGNPVGRMLKYPKWITRFIGPRLSPNELDWTYSSDGVLDSLDIPMTWLLAPDDRSAPNHETIPKLQAYRTAGKSIELVLFDGADHGMLAFEEADGERMYVGYADGYFRAEVENVLRMSALR